MRDRTVELAEEYVELGKNVKEKEQEIEAEKAEKLGANGEGTEERARDFFSDIGMEADSEPMEEIDDLRVELRELREQKSEIRDKLCGQFSDISFPLEHEIRQEGGKVVFPFKEQVPEEVFDALTSIINDAGESEVVDIQSERIVVDGEDVEEAMKLVENLVTDIRESARFELQTEDFVDDLRNRDDKVAQMLSALDKAGDKAPLQKAEIEERSGLEKDALKGQLYHVLNNDPYLKKSGGGYILTDVGETVIEKYREKYGEPVGREMVGGEGDE